MDCDTTVLGDLSELYNINIEDFYAAGVNDTSETIKECCKRLNVEKYFNSGVLLLNMEKIRNDNIYEKFLDFAGENKDIIFFPDQDILNAVLKDKVKFLGNEWNKIQYDNEYIDYKKQEIKIIHHTGFPKPWEINCVNKNRNYFFKYFSMLPLSFRIKYYYIPVIQFIKAVRQKIITFRKSQKTLIIFDCIKIKL